jgi:hypothetical protein
MATSIRLRLAEHVARIRAKMNAYRMLVAKLGGKRQLGRLRHRWVDNTKMHLREIRWGCMYWIDLVQERGLWRALVSKVMNFGVHILLGLHNWQLFKRAPLHGVR